MMINLRRCKPQILFPKKYSRFNRSFSSTLNFLSSDNGPIKLTIKAEHRERLWERRTAIVPEDLNRLIDRFGKENLIVQVESSKKRIFDDESFAEIGAEIVEEGKGDGDIIVAVKEISIDHLPIRKEAERPRTYFFFSHTHKGQSYNIGLLKRMVKSNDQFLDWELLVDQKSQIRTVSFGRLAGVVGAGEALTGYGLFALKQGYSTPLLNLPRPYVFESTEEFYKSLDSLKLKISEQGYRGELISIILTGSTGRVGRGSTEVLDRIGIRWIDDLDQFRSEVSESKDSTKHYKIIGYKLQLSDHLKRINDESDESLTCSNEEIRTFDRDHYNSNPQQYVSNFHKTIAPFTKILINAAYWSNDFPRLLSNGQLSEIIRSSNHCLRGISDISCDFGGGLEFVTRATTIESPYAFLKSDPKDHKTVIEVNWSDPAAAVQLITIEILPSELARDASVDFSSSVLPYITGLIQSKLSKDSNKSNESILKGLENATICKDGKLAPQHEGLNQLISDTSEKPKETSTEIHSQIFSVGKTPKKVIIFGSGLVAKPAIQTLLSDPSVEVVIAAKFMDEAQNLLNGICESDPLAHSRIQLNEIDAENEPQKVNELVQKADIVVSLLPASMHPLLAKPCLDHSVNLVTASYVSPAMAEFDELARSKGLIFLNELGLDPGIDHMTAVRLINRLKKDYPGWKIRSFVSFCGGLPERSDGLLGYRFSWSPRGVLEAMGNPARFKLDKKTFEIEGQDLMTKTFPWVGRVMFQGKFGFGSSSILEGVANRDSLGYIDRYGLDPHNLETMMRGTLRFEGFCEVMTHLRRIGLVRKDRGGFDWLGGGLPQRWDEVIERLGGEVPEGEVKHILKKLGLLPGGTAIDIGDKIPEFPSQDKLEKMAPIDLLCRFLSGRLTYGPGERDMVLLSHEIRIEEDSESEEERWFKSELLIKGDQDSTAMAKTVGSPIGIGALNILNNQEEIIRGLGGGGVIRPIEEVIWKDVLKRLEENSKIKMVEKEYKRFEDGIVVDEIVDGKKINKDKNKKTKRYNGLESILKYGIKNWKKKDP